MKHATSLAYLVLQLMMLQNVQFAQLIIILNLVELQQQTALEHVLQRASIIISIKYSIYK